MIEVSFECPGCNQPVAVCTSMSGQLADCPTCHTEISIPHFEFEEPEVSPTAPVFQAAPTTVIEQSPATSNIARPKKQKATAAKTSARTQKRTTSKSSARTTQRTAAAKGSAPAQKFKTQAKKRPNQKPKASIMKPVAILGIASVAIAGAVNYGLTNAEKVKAEQTAIAQRQHKLAELEEAEALREEKTRSEWNKILVLYKPALTDKSKTENVIEKLQEFKIEHPQSKFIATADTYLIRLTDLQVARVNTKNKVLENNKILTVNKLISQAQEFINSKDYIKAYNIFAEYNGPFAQDTKSLREEQMEYLSKLANGQKLTQQEFQAKKQGDFYKEIAKSIVKSKSSSPLKKYDTPEIHKEKPQLGELIDNYKKNSANLTTYFKNFSGKSTVISINGKKNIVKIIDADKTQLTISQKVSNSELKRKIKYKDIDFKDKVKAICKMAPEAGALYGLVGSLKKGDTEAAQEYSKNTGPLADGFMEYL